MRKQCVADPEAAAAALHWLIDAIAAEIAAGSPHDARAWVTRLAARLDADPYLAAMFTDPD